jgi:hypothetical protein
MLCSKAEQAAISYFRRMYMACLEMFNKQGADLKGPSLTETYSTTPPCNHGSAHSDHDELESGTYPAAYTIAVYTPSNQRCHSKHSLCSNVHVTGTGPVPGMLITVTASITYSK